MSHEDLPAVQNFSEGNTAVALPLLEDLKVIDEDNEVIGATFVENLGGCFVSTGHFEGCEGCED